jgi:cystathionine beta-synthase
MDNDMEVFDSVVAAIGNTPLVRLERLGRGLQGTLLAKLELLNPGGSVKDRIGLRMIEAAERAGRLKPGGTIVEPTSGNTGVGLAIAAAIKGYRCIFTMPDKMSQEKISLLRAYGAEVVIAPTAVPPESPLSYYRVADRLTEEIPGAFQPNQYFNQENPQAHYDTTGPEIWRQTAGRVTHFVAGVGTGGTITGTGRYLKEQNPDVVVVGADPEGSLYTGDSARPYLVEGIGEDFWPESFDPTVVDRWVTVSDRDSFLTARRCTREEGILVGGSAGTALWAALEVGREMGPDDVMVVILPDSGRSYLSKLYNDSWMIENGFLDRPGTQARIGEVLAEKRRVEPEIPDVAADLRHQPGTGGSQRQPVRRGRDRRLDQRAQPARPGLSRPRRDTARRGRGDGSAIAGGAGGGRGPGDVRRPVARRRGRARRRRQPPGRRAHARRPTRVPRARRARGLRARAPRGKRRPPQGSCPWPRGAP